MNADALTALHLALSTDARDQLVDADHLEKIAAWARSAQQDQQAAQTWREALDDCLRAVAISPVLLAWAVSHWITQEPDVPLARTLVERASRQYLAHRTPLSFDLTSFDEARAVMTAFRLCALNAAPAMSVGWLLSLARDFPQSEFVSLAAEQLMRHHIVELPSATQALFTVDGSPFRDAPIARDAAEAIAREQAALEELPWLREFAMTPAMRLQQASLNRAEQRNFQSGMRQHSVFLCLVTEHHFKYSTHAMIEFQDGDEVRETGLEMAEHRLGIEGLPPLSELTDPLLGRLRRRHLWQGLQA